MYNENIKQMLQNTTCEALLAESPMVPLSLLDSGEVKNNICPICHSSIHLERDKGFKRCIRCGSIFKIFNGKAYKIEIKYNYTNMNDIILNNIGLNRLSDNGLY